MFICVLKENFIGWTLFTLMRTAIVLCMGAFFKGHPNSEQNTFSVMQGTMEGNKFLEDKHSFLLVAARVPFQSNKANT